MTFKNLLLMAALSYSVHTVAQAPVIQSLKAGSTQVGQYTKFEVALTLSAAYSNPYDYDDIRVSAVFTSPDQRNFQVDGFFMQEYSLSNQGVLSDRNNGDFRVRFAPDQPGTWTYTLSCENAAGKTVYPEQTFTCTPATAPANKGFVRNMKGNYFVFDQGDPFIPIGQNIGWHNNNPFADYSTWLGKMAENKGNFFRLWMAHWGLGIEWRKGSNGFDGLRRYKQTNAAYLDWLMEYTASKGIYVMFCLQHHGQVSSTVNPNWGDSPYNAANGGPCARTWDFFTHETARNHTKNRFRYTLARWGYARSIMSWELFNEVDWTDDFDNRKADVATWHREMSDFIRKNDPYKHLITTSYAREQYDPALWSTPSMDFTQTHYYLDVPNLERAIANGTRQYLKDFGKPTFNGEFGLGGSAESLGNLDANGIYVHNALWGSLFSGGAGAGMTWWWDNYIHPRNLYYHFAPLAEVAAQIPFVQNRLSHTPAQVSGAPADLVLTPALGWGGLGTPAIALGENGTLQPADASLGSYLYGAQWNTQFRRPPVFQVTYAQPGKFTVSTGTSTGTNPRITLTLNGKTILDAAASVNQSYSVEIPAGAHSLRVDNTGTDWISIKSYTFSGIGSAVDAYVLASPDRDFLSAWVINHAYNHSNVKAKGLPTPVKGATLNIEQVRNGSYMASWYHCITGVLVKSEPITVLQGQLQLPIPDLDWDLALVLSGQSTPVLAQRKHLPFEVYPNPVTEGRLRTRFDLESGTVVRIALLDASGREVQPLFQEPLPSGLHEQEHPLPTSLPRGLYWIKVDAGNVSGVRPVVYGQ